MSKKIRLGIDLDHVIRDINRQIAKYYQRDVDESIDLDEIDYKDDILNTVCHFKSKAEKSVFLYEDYPLEIFGHASQVERFLSRDLNIWMDKLTNQEEYDVEIFFYSMKEFELTIQSSYFFLSKIGSRVRKVIFPTSIEELAENGDIFITAYLDNAKGLSKLNKKVVLIDTNFNKDGIKYSNLEYESFRSFLDDNDKLNNLAKILDICQNQSKVKSLWISIKSWISSLTKMRKE